jgi:ParD-like antitoxin of type II bacterial toxin-antitoxin system
MGQPVKLSEALVLDARLIGGVADRSIASQIEFWAGLGRAVESVLRTDSVLRLKQRGETVPLSDCLRTVDTKAGRARMKAHLAERPFPHFEQAVDRTGFLVKIDEDGKRTVGRFVNRVFRTAGRK